jgi:pimeloyl-ACP methyl ester carboxylesterase
MLINNHELYVELSGPAAGPAVVLLHHGLGSVRSWRSQVPTLAEAGYRVIAYDRWGYGGSDARSGLDVPWFENDRKDLQALLAGLGIARAALVGHSDGGTLALYHAVGQPRQVERLVLVAAHIYVEPKMQVGIDGVRRAYQRDERFRESLGRVHGEKAQAVFDHWYFGWRRPQHLSWDLRPLLANIRCPALVVQGFDDEHATPQHAQDLAAALPQAELWLEAGANHMLPQEQPDIFNRRLVEFLKREI